MNGTSGHSDPVLSWDLESVIGPDLALSSIYQSEVKCALKGSQTLSFTSLSSVLRCGRYPVQERPAVSSFSFLYLLF